VNQIVARLAVGNYRISTLVIEIAAACRFRWSDASSSERAVYLTQCQDVVATLAVRYGEIMIITNKHLPRRTFIKRDGRCDRAPDARCDDASVCKGKPRGDGTRTPRFL